MAAHPTPKKKHAGRGPKPLHRARPPSAETPHDPPSGIVTRAASASSWPPPPFPCAPRSPPVRRDSGAIAIDLTQPMFDEE